MWIRQSRDVDGKTGGGSRSRKAVWDEASNSFNAEDVPGEEIPNL